MIIHELSYYCSVCDRTHKVEITSKTIEVNMKGIAPSIKCSNTPKCVEAKLSLINTNKKEGCRKENRLLG